MQQHQPGTVQRKVTIHGKTGDYQALRWVAPNEQTAGKRPAGQQPQGQQRPAYQGKKGPIKGLELKDDGFYYSKGRKVTDDPQKAERYAQMILKQRPTSPDQLQEGHRIRIKTTATSSESHKARGIIATIIARTMDGIKIQDDSGKMYLVRPSALEMAKAKGQAVDAQPMLKGEPAVKLAVRPETDYRRDPVNSNNILSPMEMLKAIRSGLVQRRVTVKGPKGNYEAMRWVNPNEASAGAPSKDKTDEATLTRLAEQLGAKAYADGHKSIPIGDSKLMELVRQEEAKNTSGHPSLGVSSKLMSAWDRGWHRANISSSREIEGAGKVTATVKTAQDIVKEAQAGKKYKDVGEKIGGARKDVWAQIKAGLLQVTSSDLDTMDQPTQRDLINKKNMLPKDYVDRMRQYNVEPGAAFCIYKIFGTIGTKPAEDTEESRKNYVLAFEFVKKSLRGCKTVKDVETNFRTLREAMYGVYYNAQEAEEVAKIRALEQEIVEEQARHWKDVIVPKYYKGVRFNRDGAQTEQGEWHQKYRDEKLAASGLRLESDIRKEARARSEKEPGGFQTTVSALGKSFTDSMSGRSKTLATHIAEQSLKPKTDWSWAEGKAKTETGGVTKAPPKPKWVRVNTDSVERVGGQTKKFKPKDLLSTFGIRGVEYGNWMDDESSAHHTQMLGESFLDLSDLLGLSVEDVSMKGRLAIAFGARGKGKALAHYEPGRKVINLTKMKGGGSLAHEWFHFIDNVASMVGTEGKRAFSLMTDAPTAQDLTQVSEGVKLAWAGLAQAMSEGNHRPKQSDPVKNKFRYAGAVDRKLEAGKSPQEVIDALSVETGWGGEDLRYSPQKIADFANYIHSKTGTMVRYGKGQSQFATQASSMGTYWREPTEMAARAFEAYVYDRMSGKGQLNTYLTDPSVSDEHSTGWAAKFNQVGAPYPIGEERSKINQAFDRLFDALRTDNTLRKARVMLQGEDMDTNQSRFKVFTPSELQELIKSVKGFVKPGHRYFKRVWDSSSNAWRYFYLEDMQEKVSEKAESEYARHLQGHETIMLTELERNRKNFEERLKITMDRDAADYNDIRRTIRKMGGWVNPQGEGTISLDIYRKLVGDNPKLGERMVMNEMACTIVRNLVDEGLAEMLDPEMERPDLDTAISHNPQYNYELEPPKNLRPEMLVHGSMEKWDGIHPYQKAGVNYMLDRKSCIVGYDVGLGKTLTALATNEVWRERKLAEGSVPSPTLITCPNEVLFNWEREMSQYFDGIDPSQVLVLPPGGSAGRKVLEEMAGKGELTKYKYVVCGYGWLQDKESCQLLGQQQWGNHIIDEAHRLKSSRGEASGNYDEFLKNGNFDHRWFLTATPIPNRIEEGFTMLEHLGYGEGAGAKERQYRRLIEQERKAKKRGSAIQGASLEAKRMTMLEEIRSVFRDAAIIKTYADEDVRATLPPIETKIFNVDMTDEQKKIYLQVLTQQLEALKEKYGEDAKVNKLTNIMANLTRLNQIALHPKLVFPDYKGRSAKMDWASNEVKTHITNGTDNIVVFCEQIGALNILKKQLIEEQGIPEDQIVVIDQKLKGREKDELVQKFNRGEIRVLLGGKTAEEGINLQKNCHKCIHLDVPWVPKSLIQRNGRVARQGQKNPIQVIYPITHGTHDIHRLGLLYHKLALNETVLNVDNMDILADVTIPGTDREMSLTEVSNLLVKEAKGWGLSDKVTTIGYDEVDKKWKQTITTPDGGKKEVYTFPNGKQVPVDALSDLTKEFRDVKIPKQFQEVFNYAFHSFFELSNRKSWEDALKAKRPRLTVRKSHATIRDLIGEDGYDGYFVPSTNQVVVDTGHFSAISHEMMHLMQHTYRSSAIPQGFRNELEKVVPEYFDRVRKKFEQKDEKGNVLDDMENPRLKYLFRPIELHARCFEQAFAYSSRSTNPDFHPLVAHHPEFYDEANFYYLTPTEYQRAAHLFKKYMVDRDGAPLLPSFDLAQVPGSEVKGYPVDLRAPDQIPGKPFSPVPFQTNLPKAKTKLTVKVKTEPTPVAPAKPNPAPAKPKLVVKPKPAIIPPKPPVNRPKPPTTGNDDSPF